MYKWLECPSNVKAIIRVHVHVPLATLVGIQHYSRQKSETDCVVWSSLCICRQKIFMLQAYKHVEPATIFGGSGIFIGGEQLLTLVIMHIAK